MLYSVLIFAKILSAGVVVLGIALAFRGYQIFQALMAILGFWVGFIGVVLLGGDAINQGPLILLPAMVAGAVCSVLAAYLYILAVFLAGALGGAAVAAAAGLLIPEWFPDAWQLLTAACVAGVVVVALDKLAIVVSTATTGASCICVGGAFLIGLSSPEWVLSDPTSLPAGLLLLWLPLTIAGIVAQYHAPVPDSSRRRRREAGIAGDGDAAELVLLRSGPWAPVVGGIMLLWGVQMAGAFLYGGPEQVEYFYWEASQHPIVVPSLIGYVAYLPAGLALILAGFQGCRRSPRAWPWAAVSLPLAIAAFVLRQVPFAARDGLAVVAPVLGMVTCQAALLWFAWRGRKADVESTGAAPPPTVGLMVALALLMIAPTHLGGLTGTLAEDFSSGVSATHLVRFCLNIAVVVGAIAIGVAWLRGARSSLTIATLVLLAFSVIKGVPWEHLSDRPWQEWLLHYLPAMGEDVIVGYYLWRYRGEPKPASPPPPPPEPGPQRVDGGDDAAE